MIENDISYKIRGAIFSVYNRIGPGLLEKVYSKALFQELKDIGLKVKKEVAISYEYNNIKVDNAYRIDLLVEDKVIIEIKSVESLAEVHHKQVLTYLKVANIKLAILVNFNSADIAKNIFRKVNGL